MNVNRWILTVLSATLLACPAWAGWGVSVGFSSRPYGCSRPYHGWGSCYRPVVPIVIQPAPVYYQPATVVQPIRVVEPVYAAPAPAYAAPPPPAVAPASAVTAVPAAAPASSREIERCMAHLVNPDDAARAEAVVQLGRLHATQAVDNMSRVLASDRSPAVREAAARGLGLLGAPAALPALQQSAQADEDREVRNSARFAVDVIRSRNP